MLPDNVVNIVKLEKNVSTDYMNTQCSTVVNTQYKSVGIEILLTEKRFSKIHTIMRKNIFRLM